MNLALDLALKAKGKTSPNPLVGAVIVKNNKIVGRGFHRKAGLAHAEVVALNQAKNKANDSTLYVTLEPCSHYGRTSPCVNRIIDAGIKKVAIGMVDPNPLNNGKSVKILKKFGINVKIGVLKEKVFKINQPFIKFITKGLPYVTVKVGQSLDGKIATKDCDSKWITSSKSRNFARKLRDDFDAVVVGINTILRDNPSFNTKKAIRVIVDTNLKTPSNAKIFDNKNKVIIATAKKKINKNFSNNTEIIMISQKNGKLDLISLMKKLAALEITNIFVEGGGELIGSLFDKKLVDEIKFFIAPKIIGGSSAISSVMGDGVDKAEYAVCLKDLQIKKIGVDFLGEARVVYRNN